MSKASGKRGRPSLGDDALTPAERQRARRKRLEVVREALKENGFSERRLYVDDCLYDGLEAMGVELGEDIHQMMFLAMRAFLTQHVDEEYKRHLSLLENAVVIARLRMNEEGLGSLRTMNRDQAAGGDA